MAQHTPTSPAAADLRVVVVTPEQTVLDTSADFVALPLYDGELGVAPGHAPMIGRLGYGELRIGPPDAGQRFYLDGGFVQVVEDVVSVLTNRAIPAAKLDAVTIAENVESINSEPAAGEAQLARRERMLAQARAQLRVARGQ